IAADRDGPAESGGRARRGGSQLLLLEPLRPALDEHVRRSRTGERRRTAHDSVTAYGHRKAELGKLHRILGDQFSLLHEERSLAIRPPSRNKNGEAQCRQKKKTVLTPHRTLLSEDFLSK